MDPTFVAGFEYSLGAHAINPVVFYSSYWSFSGFFFAIIVSDCLQNVRLNIPLNCVNKIDS